MLEIRHFRDVAFRGLKTICTHTWNKVARHSYNFNYSKNVELICLTTIVQTFFHS